MLSFHRFTTKIRGGSFMRCSTKRYIAEIEIDGVKQKKPVIARTPAEARKSIRKTYGKDTIIHSVMEEKR